MCSFSSPGLFRAMQIKCNRTSPKAREISVLVLQSLCDLNAIFSSWTSVSPLSGYLGETTGQSSYCNSPGIKFGKEWLCSGGLSCKAGRELGERVCLRNKAAAARNSKGSCCYYWRIFTSDYYLLGAMLIIPIHSFISYNIHRKKELL